MADETTVVAQSDATEQQTPEVKPNAETAEAGGEATQEQGNPEHTEQEEKRKRLGGWQRKIQRLEQSEAYWRNVALSTQQTSRPAQEIKQETPSETEPPKRPKLADFNTVEEYDSAMEEYETKRDEYVSKKVLGTLEKQSKETQQKSEQQTVVEKWAKAELDFATNHDDYADVTQNAMDALHSSYRINPQTVDAIGQAIQYAANGPELLYALGQNPEELSRLAKLPTHVALMELGALKAAVAKPKAEAKEEKTVEPPPQTKAPAPPTPVKKPSTVAHVDLNDPNTPLDVWMKERRKQLERR